MKTDEQIASGLIRSEGVTSLEIALVRAGRSVGKREGEIKALRWVKEVGFEWLDEDNDEWVMVQRHVFDARLAELEKEQADD